MECARRGESWKREALHVVAQLGQRGRGGRAGQTGADHDDVVLPLVGGVDELDVELVLVPLLGQRPFGSFRFERHRVVSSE